MFKSIRLFLAVLLLLVVAPRASAQSPSTIYLPFVSSPGITVQLDPADIVAGGCWPGWDRCLYVITRAAFAQVLDDNTGAVILDSQPRYRIGAMTFATPQEFQDYLWSADGVGVWFTATGYDQVVQFR